jgi:hypothetical protein
MSLAVMPRPANSFEAAKVMVKRALAGAAGHVANRVIARQGNDPACAKFPSKAKAELSDEQPRGPGVHREVAIEALNRSIEDPRVNRFAVTHHQNRHRSEITFNLVEQNGDRGGQLEIGLKGDAACTALGEVSGGGRRHFFVRAPVHSLVVRSPIVESHVEAIAGQSGRDGKTNPGATADPGNQGDGTGPWPSSGIVMATV